MKNTIQNTVQIPVADNPQHVDNLVSISLLETQGFEGSDASLSESLFEYGLAWREVDNEYLFIHRHPNCVGCFDRSTFKKDLDVQKEFNWIKWGEITSYLGVDDLEEWLTFPLPHKISDLVSYHGYENIFGTSYWEGFKISEE